MARSREFDEEEALDAAMDTFWTHGFEATSLPMLLEAMGISRSSFYQAFDDKESLFGRCLDRYAQMVVESMNASLDTARTGRAFIEKTLESVSAEAKLTRRGCFVMNTANEFGGRHPAFEDLVSRHTKRFEKVFVRALERCASEGHLGSSARADLSTARFLLCALSGLKTMTKAGSSAAALRDTARVALGVLD